MKRQEYELRILQFISQEFSAIDIKFDNDKKVSDKKNNQEDVEKVKFEK